MENSKTFGEFIRAERELLSYNTTEAAEMLGVNRSTLFLWENDIRKPSKKHIRDIAELYCVSVKQLVELLRKK